ncbi:aminopeptidase N isoform X1 [Cotesia glomerata]|uniref:aminopeptidase N isoform X1 n=1 Tax=Cotesia glomerata TaxID=32391 RepID=UPI001D013EC4|nr:aminopeptidase N isoform X1 [Cotesia glomerata]XP_044584204.1 aminopeptidase N isoform X1 [Cotesia glomerata]
MKFIGSLLYLLLILITLSSIVTSEPKVKGSLGIRKRNSKLSTLSRRNSKGRSRRSIDFNDVVKLPGYRMPRSFKPDTYELEIKPYTINATFVGNLKIFGNWISDGSRIKLDADRGLDITNINIQCIAPNTTSTFEDANVAEREHNIQKSELNIDLEQWYTGGQKCIININYTGNISTSDSYGFFMNSYLDTLAQAQRTVVSTFLATHLRLNNARKLFPCIDEPEYKATFMLSLIRPKNLHSRSNMPLIASTEISGEPNLMRDIFEKTPEISTYQLSFMISDFESMSPSRSVNPTEGRAPLEIKIWGRKEYLPTLSKVPNKIVTIVNYLQNYFNISIGLPKLDLVAMPMYTASKASDSWGLMFFKESELSSPSVWNTAYELIYQWIGQRITPFRWSDAQVNKALNSFLASKTTVDIDPNETEGKWPMTLLYSLYYEFGKTLPFTRVAGIRHEATCSKTELVFRMFNYTLGEDIFRQGVQKFIHESAKNRSFYANEIFSQLDEVRVKNNLTLPNDLTISSIAAPWINRDRVPVVTVTRDYETGSITFTQNVFLRQLPPASNEKMSYLWDIPIIMVSQNDLKFSKLYPNLWLTKSDSTITVPDSTSKDHFVIVNPEEIGMFPVNYDLCNWQMLSEFLQGPNRETIPVLTRAKLLHDAWNMAYSGNFCFQVALNMTLFLKNETSHVVWQPFFTMIDHVGRKIQESETVASNFEAYIFSLLEPLYKNQLGETASPNEPSWKTHMRGLVKNFLCRAGYRPCIEEAKEQYKKWMKDDEPDEGNPVANEFICPVFRWGTMEEWEFGLQRVINFPQKTMERKQSERTYLLKTLAGCPVDKSKIERLLNVTILNENSNFTDSDIQLIYSTLTGSATGYFALFDFLVDHWDLMKQRFESKEHLWNGIINSATSSFSTQEGYDMVSQLYKDRQREADPSEVIIKKVMGDLEEELKWSKKNLPVIEEWLNNHLDKQRPSLLMSSARHITTTAAPTTSSSTLTPIAG